MKPRSICIGAAGWANPPAERTIRAADDSHLQHYARRFNAVEINSSFYRPHARATYERWKKSTPKEFRFSVKAPRTITHECGLRRCHSELSRFVAEIAGLGRKLRVVLVQTPGSLEFERRAVTRFFKDLTLACSSQVVCEPRHGSWFTPAALSLLNELGVSRVVADPARFPGAAEAIPGEHLVYYRLHGSPRMYYSAYTLGFLTALSRNIAALPSMTREVWCIFDNTALHASWGDGQILSKLLAAQKS